MPQITYRTPMLDDAADMWSVVDESAELDGNAAYTYLMACRNFAGTSVIAEVDGELAGVVTGYPLPSDPQRLFVWQVGVRESFRGMGIAGGMIDELLRRRENVAVQYIETTVTERNKASRALFDRVAQQFEAELTEQPCFIEDHFPDNQTHDGEPLLIIGPIRRWSTTIRIRRDGSGHRLYVGRGKREEPGLQPVNPLFVEYGDALATAEALKELHHADEIVLCNEPEEAAEDPHFGRATD